MTAGERVTELMSFGVCPSDMAHQHFATLRESIQLNEAHDVHHNRDKGGGDEDKNHEKDQDKTPKAAFITATENEGVVNMLPSNPSSPKSNHHSDNNHESHHPVVVCTTYGASSLLQQAKNGTNMAIQDGVVAPTRRAILQV